MRKDHSYSSISFSRFSSNNECSDPSYAECIFTQDDLPIISSSTATFSSCLFLDINSTSNGAGISFTSGDSLTIKDCIFISCCNYVDFDSSNGGGAVFIKSGELFVLSSVFTHCVTSSCGGGILAYRGCSSSSVRFSSFLLCKSFYGSGITSFYGPSSSVFSSYFISCTAERFGGGLYHDSQNSLSFIYTSNTLFSNNKAESNTNNNRGGGAFEDYRQAAYPSQYCFSFFTHNTAVNGKGYDISIQQNPFSVSPASFSFTTTDSECSFYNSGGNTDNWLLMIPIN